MGNKKYLNNSKLLCINLDNFNSKKFPDIVRNYIYEGLLQQEKFFIVTDHMCYEEVEKIFKKHSDFVNQNLEVKIYNCLEIKNQFDDLTNLLEIMSNSKINARVIWDFKNLIKQPQNLRYVVNFIEKIFSKLNSSFIKHFVYIKNYMYNLKLFKMLIYNFNELIILNNNKHIVLKNKSEMYKYVWLLQNNAQLKSQNNNLVLFNDEFSTIPKDVGESEFKKTIMSRVIELSNMDFCILFTSLNKSENVISLDNYYSLTKKHKYYMMNDMDFINFINEVNEYVYNNKKSILLSYNNILKSKNIVNIFNSINIKSMVCIYVEYYQDINGVFWLGKYDNNKINSENVAYIESFCKAAFFLIQEQNNFLNLQNKLIENEKLRAMGEMAAGIAHDINNVLTPILGSVQILKEKIQDKSILKQLEIIDMCANDGMQITNKVKRINRNYNNKEEWEIFNIDKLIEDAVNLTKDKWMCQSALKGIVINMNLNLKSNCFIQGNMTEIREVFINIIYNAVDAMPLGGKIEISTIKQNENVNIEIKDNGIGMNKEVIKRVFEPFFTTKGYKGCGLGLSVSYKIIQSHFGNIKIESEENVGTLFNINLPICRHNLVKNISKENIIDYNIDVELNLNVLVIDDQETIRKVVCDMIKSISKCKVKTCSDENIQTEINKRNYDIILCDFSMPNINGLQVAKIIKNSNKNVFFCLMTGWVGEFNKTKFDNIDYVLNKPISKKKLKDLFYAYVSKHKD